MSFMPPEHKAGVRFRRRLASDYTFNLNYAFADKTAGSPSLGDNSEGPSHRLDLTISKTFRKGQGEIMLGVSDLLNQVNDPIRDSTTFAGQHVPGRTFFVSMRLDF